MRSAKKALWAAALVLAALLAGLLAIGQKPSQPEEPETLYLTDLHMSSLAAAVLVNDKGSVAFYLQDGTIQMIDPPPGVEFSDSLMKSFLYRMAHMPASRSLGQTEDWAAYGLEEHQAAVALMREDGAFERVYLGDAAPLEGGWYARREDGDQLYLVDEITAQMMLLGTDDFRYLRLLPELSPESFSQITALEWEYDGQRVAITGAQRQGAVTFQLTAPFQTALDWQKVTQSVIAPLAGLQSAGFVSDTVPLAEYGLNDPEAGRLSVTVGGVSTTLLFAPADENHFYLANPLYPEVILVSREDASFLSVTAAQLMNESLYQRKPADADSLTLTAEHFSAVLELSGQGESLRGYCQGKTFSQAETVTLFQKLTLLPPAEALAEGQSLSGDSLLTLTAFLKDGTVEEVRLIPLDQRRCAVMINGAASFTTWREAAEEILRTAQSELSQDTLTPDI